MNLDSAGPGDISAALSESQSSMDLPSRDPRESLGTLLAAGGVIANLRGQLTGFNIAMEAHP